MKILCIHVCDTKIQWQVAKNIEELYLPKNSGNRVWVIIRYSGLACNPFLADGAAGLHTTHHIYYLIYFIYLIYF